MLFASWCIIVSLLFAWCISVVTFFQQKFALHLWLSSVPKEKGTGGLEMDNYNASIDYNHWLHSNTYYTVLNTNVRKQQENLLKHSPRPYHPHRCHRRQSAKGQKESRCHTRKASVKPECYFSSLPHYLTILLHQTNNHITLCRQIYVLQSSAKSIGNNPMHQ